jgi:hypothetical protein
MSSSNTIPSRSFSWKPDFDECLARVYAWYYQELLDRPPVRFHHHNIKYEQFRSAKGSWKSPEQRWLDVEFQIRAFLEVASRTTFLGETFPVHMPDLSAVVYNLFLGQISGYDDVTIWTRPCVEDLEDLPDLRVQWINVYLQAIEQMGLRALELSDGPIWSVSRTLARPDRSEILQQARQGKPHTRVSNHEHCRRSGSGPPKYIFHSLPQY